MPSWQQELAVMMRAQLKDSATGLPWQITERKNCLTINDQGSTPMLGPEVDDLFWACIHPLTFLPRRLTFQATTMELSGKNSQRLATREPPVNRGAVVARQGSRSRQARLGRHPATASQLRLACWNVRSLGVTSCLDGVHPRKSAVIDRELLRLRVDIAALSETWLTGSGSVREANFTFYWTGYPDNERPKHGVGFAICNKLLCFTETPISISPRLSSLRLHTTAGPPSPTFDILATKSKEICQQFQASLQAKFVLSAPTQDATLAWLRFRNIVRDCALSSFGRRTRKQPDWFRCYADTLLPSLANKRAARLAVKQDSSPHTIAHWKQTRSEVQRLTREAKHLYWESICRRVEHCSATGNTGGMYQGLKQALGPPVKKSSPLRSATGEILTNLDDQLNRWVEHYSSLYAEPVTAMMEAEVRNTCAVGASAFGDPASTQIASLEAPNADKHHYAQ
ncbi:unnamed protein product [Leuciscus chuanchicus]